MPDNHPDLDPFAHRDNPIAATNTGDSYPAIRTLIDTALVLAERRGYVDFATARYVSDLLLCAYDFDTERRAGSHAAPGRGSAPVHGVRGHERPPLGGAEPHGDPAPAAGGAAADGAGQRGDGVPVANWNASVHTYRHSDRGIYDGEPDGPHPCPFCDRTDTHQHPVAIKLDPIDA